MASALAAAVLVAGATIAPLLKLNPGVAADWFDLVVAGT